MLAQSNAYCMTQCEGRSPFCTLCTDFLARIPKPYRGADKYEEGVALRRMGNQPGILTQGCLSFLALGRHPEQVFEKRRSSFWIGTHDMKICNF